MTPEQKALVKASYERLVPMADIAAQLFYSRLFETHPSLRPLFKVDFRDQTVKFADMLRILIAELDRPDRVDRMLRDLAVRHTGYGVMDAHYNAVGESLVWAIQKALGREATPELKEAWVEFYNLVATTMKESAHAHQQAASSGPTEGS